jgi:hypothetical protein
VLTGRYGPWILAGMDWDELVLRPGDRAGAWGRLVRTAQGTWFEPPLAVTPVLVHHRPVSPPSRLAVPVCGADFTLVAQRYELDGDLEGWAAIDGIWTGSELRAGRHSRRRPEPDPTPAWRTPPCPPPPGGWPHGTNYAGNLDFDLGDLSDSGAAVTVVMFRPGAGRAVLVVAAADPEAVEARLRPQLGQRLCVVPSRWARHDIDAVRGHLRRHWEDWNIYQSAVAASEDAQALVTASLAQVLPEIAAWAATLPAGILTLKPWLVPARAVR